MKPKGTSVYQSCSLETIPVKQMCCCQDSKQVDAIGKEFHNVKNMLPSEKVVGWVKKSCHDFLLCFCFGSLGNKLKQLKNNILAVELHNELSAYRILDWQRTTKEAKANRSSFWAPEGLGGIQTCYGYLATSNEMLPTLVEIDILIIEELKCFNSRLWNLDVNRTVKTVTEICDGIYKTIQYFSYPPAARLLTTP